MERILEKLLDPAVVWIIIPVLAILFWGLRSMVQAVRGNPQELETLQAEVRDLSERVEKLERLIPRPMESDRQVVSGRN
jgi:hypothetical protein